MDLNYFIEQCKITTITRKLSFKKAEISGLYFRREALPHGQSSTLENAPFSPPQNCQNRGFALASRRIWDYNVCVALWPDKANPLLAVANPGPRR